MAQWYERLLAEQEEVNTKLNQLHGYIHSDYYPTLKPAYQDLIQRQYKAMLDYHQALKERAEFGEDTGDTADNAPKQYEKAIPLKDGE